MAIVAYLRFDERSGGIVSDEDMWSVRFRRKSYLDNLHSLIDADIADSLGLEVCLAGAGVPSLLSELVQKSRAELRRRWDERGQGEAPSQPFATVHDVGYIVHEVLQRIVRRRVDLRMKFYYGFDSTDLNRGSFEDAGKKFEIGSEPVRDKASKIARLEEKGRMMKPLFDSRFAVAGWSAAQGFDGYFLDPEKSFIAFNYEGWEAIGKGRYAAGGSLADWIDRRPLAMRLAGVGRAEGMLELLKAAQAASRRFQEVGGNINIVYVDGSAREHGQRYRELFDDRAHLAGELVKAHTAGLLGREDCLQLLERVLFAGEDLPTVEKALFERATETRALELVLRGYKAGEIAELARPAPRTRAKEARQ